MIPKVFFLLLALVLAPACVDAQTAAPEAEVQLTNQTEITEILDENSDGGTCWQTALDIFKCGGNETACTCFEDLWDQEGKVKDFVSKDDSTCADMQSQVCGLLEKARGCCPPCEATISRAILCEEKDHFLKKKNCTEVQECVAESIASGATAAINTLGLGLAGVVAAAMYWMV